MSRDLPPLMHPWAGNWALGTVFSVAVGVTMAAFTLPPLLALAALLVHVPLAGPVWAAISRELLGAHSSRSHGGVAFGAKSRRAAAADDAAFDGRRITHLPHGGARLHHDGWPRLRRRDREHEVFPGCDFPGDDLRDRLHGLHRDPDTWNRFDTESSFTDSSSDWPRDSSRDSSSDSSWDCSWNSSSDSSWGCSWDSSSDSSWTSSRTDDDRCSFGSRDDF